MNYSHMTAPVPLRLKSRKQPAQARSQATVEAIFEATIQVLLRGGTRALYHASTELDMKDLGTRMIARLTVAARDLLESAPDSRSDDLDGVVFSWVAVVTGGTRQIFEADGTIERLPVFREQLLRMSRAYLAAAA